MHRQKFASPYKSSQITPEAVYHNRPHRSRRDFLRASLLAAGGVLLAACNSKEAAPTQVGAQPTAGPGPSPTARSYADELGDPANTFAEITSFNNYYEFSLDKEQVAVKSERFASSPWQVEVGGLVNKPAIFDLDALRKLEQEERVYRMRCVEGWSMVLPWQGFPLARLLDEVEPLPEARYVGFMSVLRPEEMPGQISLDFPWPYLEGLRLDEARHDLTILATGLYGAALTPQNGGPIRLVVPWKYGFKSLKAVVRITLQADQPVTFWNAIAPHEYGFYANVNPAVDHPRWAQSEERRIGENGSRPTLLFNGYDEVAPLYEGMDLRLNF